MCIAELSRVTQRNGETIDFFYLLVQEDEKQMQGPSSRDRVREKCPKEVLIRAIVGCYESTKFIT